LKNFVKYFLIIWFSIAFLCQCFAQCDYEKNTGDTVLTEYQTVYMDSARAVHLSLIKVGGSIALEVSCVTTSVNEPHEICLDKWSTLKLILSNGPEVVVPFIGADTCSVTYNQTKGTYMQYISGVYELDDIHLALLERNQVDSLIMHFVKEITGTALPKKVKHSSRGRPTSYGRRKFNSKQYFTNQLRCLTWERKDSTSLEMSKTR